jgi:hypothetical protein
MLLWWPCTHLWRNLFSLPLPHDPTSAPTMLSVVVAAGVVASAHASPLIGAQPKISSPRLLADDFIELHNAKQSSWTAGKTPFSDMTVDEFGAMMGDNPKPTEVSPTLTAEWPLQGEWERMTAANTTFPDWFDPRHRWHWCPTLSQVRDQGMCGSCWAHGVTEALSDRYCTMANITTSFSAHDVSFCCKTCGAGCGGGDPEKALKYLNATGSFTSTCLPYDQGDHRSHHPWPQPKGTDVCPTTCEDSEDLAATRCGKRFPSGEPFNLILKPPINLPRQARDKHKETLRKQRRFPQAQGDRPVQRPAQQDGKKPHLFAPLYTKNDLFYQDRLGTNTGKT